NTTKTQNISLELVPVTVSGSAFYMDNGINGVNIDFSVNESVDRNTAEEASATTDENGKYSIDLKPGSYNISIIKTDITSGSIIYVLEGETLVLTKGQKPVIKDFILEKKSVTVNGVTTASGKAIENVTLDFVVDYTISNNTAVGTYIISDQDGLYTVELTPGSYNVTGRSEQYTENGVNYTYTGYKLVTVTEENIPTGITFNFDTLVRTED
ncbi:MAG: hypothetical protein BV456_06010, partial [Thermoplasmata archaeon M8B2D]